MFPVSDALANVGVGLMRLTMRDRDVNLRRLFEDFVATLGAGPLDIGPLAGAPLACDFSPGRCAAPGIVLVGDAAGLVDPLSGEGIDTALASGLIAAEAIDEALAAGLCETPDYGARLQTRFGPRIASAWAMVEHHDFIWDVVSQTIELDRPLYRGARRAIRTYDGDVPTPEPRDWLRAWLAAHDLLEETCAIEAAVAGEAGGDMPMIDGVVAELRDSEMERLRIAVLLICAGMTQMPAADRSLAARLAIACELACLARAAHDDTLDAADTTGAANLFAVSIGDALLFRAYALASALGGWAVTLMSRASAAICVGTLLDYCGDRDLDPARHRASVADATIGEEFALSARLGARLAGASPDSTERLVGLGRAIGLIHDAARRTCALPPAFEDVLPISGELTAALGALITAAEDECQLHGRGMPALRHA